jgi:pimeloyl-ACP methyl ester carboxylesterase
MSDCPTALWVSVSPALSRFNRPLLNTLARRTPIAEWQYLQNIDEPTCLETALVLLHDYLKHQDHPIHLLGHSISGLVALLYARRYPERVRSLTLLSVGTYPAIDWQAHYYTQLQLLPCSRETLLHHMVCALFGTQPRPLAHQFIKILEQDLKTSLSPHSLYKRISIAPVQLDLPLLICGSQDDAIIDRSLLDGWRSQFSEPGMTGRRQEIWTSPSGRHFFHYFNPEKTQRQIWQFWQSIQASSPVLAKV